jgi:enoyl-CoA hydratase/carnithine racemase
LRIATPEAKTAFLFNRVGLAGCDMGACAILPRIIGQGRAADLLYTGRAMSAEEGERWGFTTGSCRRRDRGRGAQAGQADRRRADLRQHDDQDACWQPGMEHGPRTGDRGRSAGQAICMQTQDFRRAYEAFVAKEKPVFEGN